MPLYINNNEMNKIFFCYAQSDIETAQRVVNDLSVQNIFLSLELNENSLDELDDRVFPMIEERDIFLVLASDNSRTDQLVKDCVKFASDLNKTVVAIGFHKSGMFSSQSWIKKEWNIRTDEVPYLDEDSRAEFYAMMRAWLGMALLPGDKIGEEVSISVSADGELYRDRKFISALKFGETTVVRLKKGTHNLQVIGLKYGNKMILEYEKVITKNIGKSNWIIDIKAEEESRAAKILAEEQRKRAELERKEQQRLSRIEKLEKNIIDYTYGQEKAANTYNQLNKPFKAKDWEPNHVIIIGISAVIAFFTGLFTVVIWLGIGYYKSYRNHDKEESARRQRWYYQLSNAKEKYEIWSQKLRDAQSELRHLQSFSYLDETENKRIEM